MIEIENLSKTYGESRVVVDVTMAVPANSITVIVGTSGSGKSHLIHQESGYHVNFTIFTFFFYSISVSIY